MRTLVRAGLAPALLLVAAPAGAADAPTVRGRLAAADPSAHRIVVHTTGGRDVAFAVTPQSKMELDGRAVALSDLKPGRQVRVTYRAVDGANRVVALRPAVVSDADLHREVSQALAATKDYTFQHKDEYAARGRAVLDDIDDRIDQLEAEARQGGADAARRLRPRIDQLKKHRGDISGRLDRLRSATADAWTDLSTGFRGAANELDRFIHNPDGTDR